MSLLSLALLLPASANATAFHDEATGLTLYLTVPGATLCFIKPAPLRQDRPECKDIDREAAQELEASTSLFTLVRFPEWTFAISGGRLSKELHGPISRLDGRDFIKGWTEQGRAFTAEEPEFLVVNGLQVMRFVAHPTAAQPSYTFLNYLLAGEHGLMRVSFLTDEEHLARVKVVAQAVMASADMAHEEAPPAWTNPDSELPGYRMGVLAMQVAFQLGILTLLCTGAILLFRWLRGRAKRT